MGACPEDISTYAAVQFQNVSVSGAASKGDRIGGECGERKRIDIRMTTGVKLEDHGKPLGSQPRNGRKRGLELDEVVVDEKTLKQRQHAVQVRFAPSVRGLLHA